MKLTLPDVLDACPRWRFGLVVLALGGAPLGGPALADQRTDPDAACAMARATLVDLKVAGSAGGGATELDYAAASMLLGYAHALAPKDEDILRLLIEAEASAGSRERLMELTAELLKLAPADTVAQLRLISGKISSQQTVDRRLEIYRQFLGPKGESIAASVRSRLAVDGALLRREQGDLAGFAEWVTRATQLDSTNKEAATLALNIYDQRALDDAEARRRDPAARLELLQNLLLADPLDESTHLAIAYELAGAGDWQGAANFFELYGTLTDKRGQQIPAQVQAAVQINLWQRRGARELVETLRDHIERQRRDVQRQRQAIMLAQEGKPGFDASQLPDAQQVRLPLDVERIRLAAAVALGQGEMIDYAFAEAKQTIALTQQAIDQRLNPPAEGLTPAEAADAKPVSEEERTELARRQRWLKAELTWLRILAGREVDQAKQDLQQLAMEPDADPAGLERMEGWLALRTGDLARAQTLLAGEGAGGGDEFAKLGAAMLAELREAAPSAIEQYEQIAQDDPGSIAGAFARTRYAALAGHDVPDAPGVEQLRRAASAMPVWVKAMADSPQRFMSLSVQMDKASLEPLDKASMTITVRNTSPIPLAVGPERTIQSRLLLVPKVEIGLNELPTASALEVVNLDRRLMLAPGESMTASVWPDAGSLGWTIDELAVGTARIRWRVLQGFQVGKEGYFVPAPISLSAESGSITRVATPKAQSPTASLITAIRDGSVREMAEALTVVRARIIRRPAQPDIISQLEEADAWAALIERWKTLDTAGKILALASMPTRAEAPAGSSVDDAIAGETDPAVLAMMLLTRADSVESPLLAEGRFADRPDLQVLARACRQQLKDNVPTYARLGSPFAAEPARGGSGGGGGGQQGGSIFR